jgi:hypothetical protein
VAEIRRRRNHRGWVWLVLGLLVTASWQSLRILVGRQDAPAQIDGVAGSSLVGKYARGGYWAW